MRSTAAPDLLLHQGDGGPRYATRAVPAHRLGKRPEQPQSQGRTHRTNGDHHPLAAGPERGNGDLVAIEVEASATLHAASRHGFSKLREAATEQRTYHLRKSEDHLQTRRSAVERAGSDGANGGICLDTKRYHLASVNVSREAEPPLARSENRCLRALPPDGATPQKARKY